MNPPPLYRIDGLLAARDLLSSRLATGCLFAVIGLHTEEKALLVEDLLRLQAMAFLSARRITTTGIFAALRDAKGHGASEPDVVERFCFPRLLIIEDYQVRGESAWEDRVLTHIIDRRYDDQHDTILISNQSAADFQASAGPSIVSRLNETGGVIECNWPSYRPGAAQ